VSNCQPKNNPAEAGQSVISVDLDSTQQATSASDQSRPSRMTHCAPMREGSEAELGHFRERSRIDFPIRFHCWVVGVDMNSSVIGLEFCRQRPRRLRILARRFDHSWPDLKGIAQGRQAN
jgi:hypothetical protein